MRFNDIKHSINYFENLKIFENRLDNELNNLKILEYDGEKCIKFYGELIETAFMENKNALIFESAFRILLPHLIKNTTGKLNPPTELLLDALHFSTHYYNLRDYLYYTYNVPNSIKWNFNEKDIEIQFKDKSIPRQYYLESNNWFLESMELCSSEQDNEISNRIKGIKEFECGEKHLEIQNIILNEVERKFEKYYQFINQPESIKLGKYTLEEYISVYKNMMLSALYSRYFAKTNSVNSYTIHYPKDALAKELSQNLSLPIEACENILFDLSYSIHQDNQDPENFPLIFLEHSNIYLMIPTYFALSDGFANILRIWAKRDPNLFLSEISNKIGDKFVNHIGSLFKNQGFNVRKNINLSKINKNLPDIDILAISKEPTLGFQLFICELKNPLPANWAKSRLKAVGKNSYIEKAFLQLDKIGVFLQSKEGLKYLLSLFSEEFGDFQKEFKGGFVALINFIVITSQNAGMFYINDNQKKVIIDYRNFERIIKRSDGDVCYFKKQLNNLFLKSNDGYELVKVSFQLEDILVKYEIVSLTPIFASA